jgi:Uma2 family endonuclease
VLAGTLYRRDDRSPFLDSLPTATMAFSARKATLMTLDEFLSWETEQLERHEFFRGEVFSMAGASQVHNVVTLNLAVALHKRLDLSACRVLANDMRVRIDTVDAMFYPDVVVSCSRSDRTMEHALVEPRFIAEVLSPSTGSFDKSAKFAAYRRIPALAEYLLVEPHTRIVELFRRTPVGTWEVTERQHDDTLRMESLGIGFPAMDLFVGLD